MIQVYTSAMACPRTSNAWSGGLRDAVYWLALEIGGAIVFGFRLGRFVVRQFIEPAIRIPIKHYALLLGIILAFSAIIRIPTDELRLSMRLFFELGVGYGLSVYLWQHNKWVAMFVALATFSVLFPIPLIRRFYVAFLPNNKMNIWQGYMAFNAIVYGVIWYAMLLRIDPERMHLAYNAMCIIALVNVYWLVLQSNNSDPLFHSKEDLSFRGLTVALMGNPHLASGLLAICFPAFFYVRPQKKRIGDIANLCVLGAVLGYITWSVCLFFLRDISGLGPLKVAVAIPGIAMLGFIIFTTMLDIVSDWGNSRSKSAIMILIVSLGRIINNLYVLWIATRLVTDVVVKYWRPLCIPFLFWGLVACGTFSGPATICVGICVFTLLSGTPDFISCNRYYRSWMKYVFKVLPIGICALVATVYWRVIDGTYLTSRTDPWKFAWILFKQHWILGSGIGGWADIGKLPMKAFQGASYRTLHNDLWQSVFEMGALAGVIFLGYFTNIARRVKQCFATNQRMIIPLSGLANVTVNSMWSFPFHVGTTAIVSITWMSLLEVSLRGK
jgi:hypothetical protein